MTDFAEGGMLDEGEEPFIIDNGYIIPEKFAREWARSILDRLNGGSVDYEEDCGGS